MNAPTLREALTELSGRIKCHPAYADLTEAEEESVGGDTAEFSYLARVADEALAQHDPLELVANLLGEYGLQAMDVVAAFKVQQDEPVAWIEHHKGGDNLCWEDPGGTKTPLYAAPLAAPAPTYDAVAEVIGCFDAAFAEGLHAALANTADLTLKDLVERRLMHALYAAQGVAAPQPAPVAQPLTEDQARAVIKQWQDQDMSLHIDLVRMTERALLGGDK